MSERLGEVNFCNSVFYVRVMLCQQLTTEFYIKVFSRPNCLHGVMQRFILDKVHVYEVICL